jgi:uncharacterized repeat protein (TIGR01451 family)
MVGMVRMPGRDIVSFGGPGLCLVRDAFNSRAKNTMADKVQSRGLTRRLTQVAFSVSALAGSGWGVYQYQGGDETSQAIAAAGQARMEQAEKKGALDQAAGSGRSAADELKYLFSSESTPAVKQTVRSAPTTADTPAKLGPESNSATDNRYARYSHEKQPSVDLPPVVQLPASSTQNPLSAVPPVVPFAGQPEPGPAPPPGDRYEAAASLLHAPATVVDPAQAASPPPVSAPIPVADPALISSPTEPSQPEVTRGQEPVNPLRTKAPLPVETPLARESQPRPAMPQNQSSVEKVHVPFGDAGQETRAGPSPGDVSVNLSQARPLASAVPAPASNHYRSTALLEGTRSQAGRKSADGLDRQSRSTSRQPAAAFAMDAAALGTANLGTIPPGATIQPNNISSNATENPYSSGYPRSESPTPTPGLTNREGTGRPGERLLEGIQNPSISIEKLAPPEIQVGKKCTFAIRVRNTGQRTAQNVKIHDEVPLGTQLLGTAPRATVNGSNLVWDLGTLSVGEERTVEMELIPTEEGELGSVATVTFATQASAKARSTRPELALRLSCSKPKVLAGNQQQVQIEVSNPGSGDATGVILLATVPAGVSHSSGPALELEIGTLPSGQSRQFELVLNAEQAGPIENVMTARADANLQVQATCEFEVIAPQLRLNVKGPEKRYLERPATYQVSVENPGTAPAKEVQLVTHLPKGLQFVKANNMGEYHAATHSVHWSLTELPANQQGMVELVALPVEAGEQILQIDTQASQGLADHTEKRVQVEGLAALMFEVVDTEDPIEVGGETAYVIRVTNQGSKSAANVQVVARMPAGIRAISAEGETGHSIGGERVEFAPLAQLEPKAVVIYRIGVQGLQPGDQRIQVRITTDEIQQPITKEESTRVYSDQ